MALPTIKVAVSNGHFQESLQNWGDRGTWDSATYDGSTNTTLEDKQANWVVDEFNGYIVVTDTGGTPTALPIVDTTGQTIVVAGNHSAQNGKVYRIAGGITATVTANASTSTSIALTAIKNKYGTAHNPVADEFKNMTFVPDKLDGTAYTITANTAGTAATTLTIGTSIVTTATSCEIGRGASASLYPEMVKIDADLNEPKQLDATVMYDISTFENDDSITNPLQLGATARVSESTGGTLLFDGIIHECPTDKSYETNTVSFMAYDRLSIMDYTIIPGVKITDAGQLPTFGWSKATPLVETGSKGWQSDNKIFQTKAFQDFTYVSQPLGLPIATTNTDGTWSMLGITNTVTNSDVMQYSSGGLQSDLIKKGSAVINFTQKKVTFVEVIDSDTQITTVDSIWNTSDKFAILSCNWQVGAGIVSNDDYSAGSGWGMNAITRVALAAPSDRTTENTDATHIFVGTSAGADTYINFTGRAWVIMFKTDHSTVGSRTKFEFAHYNGYLLHPGNDKYFLNAYNQTPEESRHTRGDLTNSWKTSDSDERGIAWDSGSYVVEIFPNRLGGSPPSIFWDEKSDPMEANT